MKVTFLKSCAMPKDYPPPLKPEVAVVGRSNAGKSSFINALTRQKVARVSQVPGKTRLLQFFDLAEKIYMVDMPGYGFATGSRKEIESWKVVIETYLTQRETLKGVLLIMDIRREFGEHELMLQKWFEYHKTNWALVLNKSDKLSRSQALQKAAAIGKQLRDENVQIFVISAMKKQGIDKIQNLLFKEWGE